MVEGQMRDHLELHLDVALEEERGCGDVSCNRHDIWSGNLDVYLAEPIETGATLFSKGRGCWMWI